MFRAIAVTSLLLLAFASGCFGGGDDNKTTSPTTGSTSPPAGNETVNLTVTIVNHTTQGQVGGKINVTWQLSLPPSLNQTLNTTHTHVHWGNVSVPDAKNGTYPNETLVQEGPVPGTYNTSFTVQMAGDVYFRAHAEIGNRSYWSDEIKMNVTAGTPKPGTTHLVEIGKTLVGPIADFAPATVNIKVGDAVKWKNIDKAAVPHSAQSTSGTPSFNTNSISANQESSAIVFASKGTWDYRCGVHPNTMTGAKVVVA